MPKLGEAGCHSPVLWTVDNQLDHGLCSFRPWHPLALRVASWMTPFLAGSSLLVAKYWMVLKFGLASEMRTAP